jgi:hypothetical protein
MTATTWFIHRFVLFRRPEPVPITDSSEVISAEPAVPLADIIQEFDRDEDAGNKHATLSFERNTFKIDAG